MGWVSLILAAAVSIPGGGCGKPKSLTVYSASSLRLVVAEAARQYTKKTGIRVDLTFGGAAALAKEIERGVPVDVFLSSDPNLIDAMEVKGLLEPATARVLAWNSLVVVVPADRGPAPINQYLLVDYARIVVGDPERTPIGRYTQQGLTVMGIWNAIQEKLVYAPDSRAALDMVERGEADAGIVYATDAIASSKVVSGFKLSEGTHDVIAYTGAVLRGSGHDAEARAFLEFLGGATGKAIFREFGFLGN